MQVIIIVILRKKASFRKLILLRKSNFLMEMLHATQILGNLRPLCYICPSKNFRKRTRIPAINTESCTERIPAEN